ncbi:blue light receptor [Kappamyces sp. JEL0829]|nr:blue light receptor [Kappamyces sp. JEL0829]
MGITFSFLLTPTATPHSSPSGAAHSVHSISDSPKSQAEGTPETILALLPSDTPSAAALFYGYQLEPAVKTVSSISLMRRMRKRQGFKRSLSVNSLGSSSTPSQTPKKGVVKNKNRKVSQLSAFVGECVWCGTHKTAQWRRGPTGARGLCNRCGIEWAKHVRNEAKLINLSIPEAEELLTDQWKNGERFTQYLPYKPQPPADSTVGSPAESGAETNQE